MERKENTAVTGNNSLKDEMCKIEYEKASECIPAGMSDCHI
ncbi:hypothetical protein [Ruminococcus sp. AF31-8BH]|nr:hypothetical protein [Ruminococcus sp. AF31-8BH]